MQRDGRIAARVAHTVDVGGGEVKALGGPKNTIARRSVDRQALLAHAPADHGDRARGDVVVVKAGVVVVHPADQPSGQVRVGEQLLVDALGVVVVDAADPQLRPLGELGDEGSAAPGQSGHGRAGAEQGERGSHRRASTLAGRCQPKARAVASASRSQSSGSDVPSSAGSTTGRSEP